MFTVCSLSYLSYRDRSIYRWTWHSRRVVCSTEREKPARTRSHAHLLERTNERTNSVSLPESCFLGGQISLEDNAPSHSHACLRPSVCLSLCPRTHCALRIPIWTEGAQVFHSMPSGNQAKLQFSPSKSFLEINEELARAFLPS